MRSKRTLRQMFVAAAILFSMVAGASQSYADEHVAKSWAYAPFSVKSTKEKKEISDEFISENLMCKPTTQNIADFMNLVQNFDLLGTSSTDGTVSMTTFRGKQAGAPAEVTFAVQTSTRVLEWVWVNGKPNLQCDHF